jgi:hypothetical protein
MTTSTIDGALQATFRCATCNGVAATATYVQKGESYPDPFLKDVAHESDWLVIEGFLGTQGKLLESYAAAVREALEKSSAKQLYHVDRLWAPFYCSRCQASYCWDCWRTFPVMDDEYPGWYDYTEGICPKGHERMIDD